MRMRTKLIIGLLSSGAILSLCMCTGGGAMIWRYYASGVNPLNEIKHHMLGVSVEIKEGTDDATAVPRKYKDLFLDDVNHGRQFEPPTDVKMLHQPEKDFSRLPTLYHHPDGPVGFFMQTMNWFPGPVNTFHADARIVASIAGQSGSPWSQLSALWSEPPIGVIMMKTGTLAGYAHPYQVVDFYEQNPAILRLSVPQDATPAKFTYIADARKRGAVIRVFEGNERTTFDQKATDNFYRLLFVDTIRGQTEVVCKELLTQEAMQRYFKSMKEEGIVCYHVSNRNYRLGPVVISVANSLQFHHLAVSDSIGPTIVNGRQLPPTKREKERFGCHWVFVARKAEYLAQVRGKLLEYEEERKQKDSEQLGPNIGNYSSFKVREGIPTTSHVWRDNSSNSLASLKITSGPIPMDRDWEWR
jgi:hypothetical protein